MNKIVSIAYTAAYSEKNHYANGKVITQEFAKKIAGAKYLNKAARLAILATDGLRADVSGGFNSEEVGLCVASFGSNFDHIINQHAEILNNDTPMISPLLGPNNTPNAISGQLSIYHQTKAFAVSFNDSGTAGLEALIFGIKAISGNRAKRVLVCGTESIPRSIANKIIGIEETDSIGKAVAVVLSASEKQISDEIPEIHYVAHGRSFVANRNNAEFHKGIMRCLTQVYRKIGISSFKIDMVVLGSHKAMHAIEYQAVKDVFGNNNFKTIFPEHNDRTMQCISGLEGVHIISKLYDYLSKKSSKKGGNTPTQNKNILINDFNQDGSMGSLMISFSARGNL